MPLPCPQLCDNCHCCTVLSCNTLQLHLAHLSATTSLSISLRTLEAFQHLTMNPLHDQ